MKQYLMFLTVLIFAYPAFAQTTNTTTTNTTNTTTGTTNATVTTPGNVIVSTPNGTIGNQVNTPANTNNVYVVTPNGSGVGSGQNYNNLSPRERDEIEQRRAERAYDAAQSQHDYRDRANYYNIRRNERVESDNGGSTSQLTRRNYQADYHSNYRNNR